ncbi:MFS transporter [Nocardioides sp. BGMRC 2183]|nr:MFS transporter [Nocardioides sp. BGMRC 2183]
MTARHERPWGTVGLAAFLLLASSVVMPTLLGLLAVEVTRDLDVGDRGLGSVIAGFWLVTAVASPLCGRWADGRGWRHGATTGAAVVAACLLSCVLLVDSWAGLVVVFGVAGVGYALCSPTSNLLVVSGVPAPRRASVLGFKQTAPPVLTALAGATLPALAHAYGWRPAMLLGLALPVSVLVMVTALGGVQHPPALRERGVRDRASEPSGAGSEPGPMRPMPVVAAAGLGTLSVATVTGFAVLTLVGAGVAPVLAASIVSGGSMLAVLARLFAGAYLDARPAGDLAPLVWLMAVAAVGIGATAVGLFGGELAPGGAWVVVVAVGVVVSLVAAWTWPALLLIAVVRRARGPGAASGLLQMGSGVGSAIGPLVFGLLSDAGGRGWAWLVMVGSTVLAMHFVRIAGRSSSRVAEGVTVAAR